MNKQELIEELECLEVPADSYSYFRGAKYVVERSISLAKQLDEPKKVVVPQFVAEWIELYKKENKTTLWHVMNKIINEKFLNHQNIVIWFENDSNKHILEQAWVNGYEVEKEPLYAIKGLTDYFRYENKVILFNDKQEALDIANKIGEYCDIEEFDYANNSNFILSREF